MTKQQIEKKYKVKLKKEINSYMGGRYFWSVKDESGKEINRCDTLTSVERVMQRKVESKSGSIMSLSGSCREKI